MTKIFAHRGASGEAPENTLEAFALAMKQGADGIELDVQLTKDGELVVIHDETIDRVSDGKGFVREYTLKELRKFSFHNHMEAYRGVAVPTLQEVLQLVKESTMEINIELKTGIFWYEGIERKTMDIVKEVGMQDRIIYSSFNHYSVQKVRELDMSAQTAYLYSDVILDVEKYARQTGVNGIHPALYHMGMADFRKRYKESGLKVRVWTVNEEKHMKSLLEEGVEAIITNYPEKAISVRKEVTGC
ncbi:MAG: glycerophosphodiester phosphodiesterase [Lachnospiraceae bacterium]